MFTVSTKTYFWASHQLTLPDGSKEPLHHHNWSVITNVSSKNLNNLGFVIDFQQLKATVDNIVAEFADIPLNRIDYLQQNSPSAENVAKYIYEKLEPKLPKDVNLNYVKVVEQLGYSAKFGK